MPGRDTPQAARERNAALFGAAPVPFRGIRDAFKAPKALKIPRTLLRNLAGHASRKRSPTSRTMTKQPLATVTPAPTSLSPGQTRMVCGWLVSSTSTASEGASRRFSRSLMAILCACEITRQVSGVEANRRALELLGSKPWGFGAVRQQAVSSEAVWQQGGARKLLGSKPPMLGTVRKLLGSKPTMLELFGSCQAASQRCWELARSGPVGGERREIARASLLARGSFGAIRQRVGSVSALFGGSKPASCPERSLQESTSLRSGEFRPPSRNQPRS